MINQPPISVLTDSVYTPSKELVERIKVFYTNQSTNSLIDDDSKWCLHNTTMANKKEIHDLLLQGSLKKNTENTYRSWLNGFILWCR